MSKDLPALEGTCSYVSGIRTSAYQWKLFVFQFKPLNIHPEWHQVFGGSEGYTILRVLFKKKKLEI